MKIIRSNFRLQRLHFIQFELISSVYVMRAPCTPHVANTADLDGKKQLKDLSITYKANYNRLDKRIDSPDMTTVYLKKPETSSLSTTISLKTKVNTVFPFTSLGAGVVQPKKSSARTTFLDGFQTFRHATAIHT